jgi:hypothetical protein
VRFECLNILSSERNLFTIFIFHAPSLVNYFVIVHINFNVVMYDYFILFVFYMSFWFVNSHNPSNQK